MKSINKIDTELLADTLYNDRNENTPTISVNTNLIVSDDDCSSEGWSQSRNVQNTWSSVVEQELASIASFDPRPHGPPPVLKEKRFFDTKSKTWVKMDSPQLCPTVMEPSESLPAFWAVQHNAGAQGVDFRPHIWDLSLIHI